MRRSPNRVKPTKKRIVPEMAILRFDKLKEPKRLSRGPVNLKQTALISQQIIGAQSKKTCNVVSMTCNSYDYRLLLLKFLARFKSMFSAKV
jgi:hypothetical protein